jgi:hypothetical protein
MPVPTSRVFRPGRRFSCPAVQPIPKAIFSPDVDGTYVLILIAHDGNDPSPYPPIRAVSQESKNQKLCQF